MFGQSAAGTLRQVVRDRGSGDEVLGYGDDLSFGPLSGLNDRIEWFNRQYPDLAEWDWIGPSEADFWDTTERSELRLRAWLAPASAVENCAFHAFCARIGDRPVNLTVSDTRVRFADGTGGALGLGSLNADEMADLLDSGELGEIEDRRGIADRWRRLCDENGRLRVVENGHPITVSDDHFDHLLVAACTGEWRKSMRVVAEAMVAGWNADHQISDLFLSFRLRALVESGVIEADGPIHGPDDRWRTRTMVRRSA